MGYETYFTLSMSEGAPKGEIKRALEGRLGLHPQDPEERMQRLVDGRAVLMKWYSNAEDMAWLSTLFPRVVFILHGKGEDGVDDWTYAYHGGRCLQPIDEWKYIDHIYGEGESARILNRTARTYVAAKGPGEDETIYEYDGAEMRAKNMSE
jgi:hypothetical protein